MEIPIPSTSELIRLFSVVSKRQSFSGPRDYKFPKTKGTFEEITFHYAVSSGGDVDPVQPELLSLRTAAWDCWSKCLSER